MNNGQMVSSTEEERENSHLRGFLPVARIRPGLLALVVIGTPRPWLLGYCRGLTWWICAEMIFVGDLEI